MAENRNQQGNPNQPEQKQGFQGGGRTGTPFTPDQNKGRAPQQGEATPQNRNDYGQITGKEGERRSGQSPGGRTGPGADTEPL